MLKYIGAALFLISVCVPALAEDVVVFGIPGNIAFAKQMTPDDIQEVGCEFTAPAGAPGAVKLQEILRKQSPTDLPKLRYGIDVRIAILSGQNKLFMNEFGVALEGEQVRQYSPDTVSRIRHLLGSKDFTMVRAESEFCERSRF